MGTTETFKYIVTGRCGFFPERHWLLNHRAGRETSLDVTFCAF